MKAIGFAAVLMGLMLAGGLNAQEGFSYIVPPAGGGSYLGVGVADVNAERVKALKLKEERGVEITSVEGDSPAAKAGLKAHDVVLEYNGQRVEGTQQFMRMVRETPPERQARFLISRDGATQTLTVTISIRPWTPPPVNTELLTDYALRAQNTFEKLRSLQMPDIPRPNMSWQSGMLGVEAESLTDQLAEFFGVKEGVLVRSVVKDSAAAKAGLKAGDVITKVDETKVTAPREVTNAIRSLRSKKAFPVTVIRNHKETTVSVTLEEKQSTTGSRFEMMSL
jgi:serine protease Do